MDKMQLKYKSNARDSLTGQQHEIQCKFAAIVARAESLGLTAEHLASLESVQELRDLGCLTVTSGWRSNIYVRRFLWALGALLTMTIFMLIVQWPATRLQLISFLFGADPDDFEKQPCLLPMEATPFAELARPPVNCAICRGLKSVDRVSQISSEKFESKYAYSARPVVITDAMTNWTAVEAFSFEFFKGIYSEDSPVMTMGHESCQFFPYKTSFNSLSEVFNMTIERAHMQEGSEPWYIGWSNCDSSATSLLRAHYTRPYFLPKVAESSRIDWIFMGTPGYGAHLHIDNVGNPSWQAQVTGTKLWTLEPPSECYLECEPRLHVIVHPTEIIVLDTDKWYHATKILGNDMSITIGSEYD